MSRKRRHNAAVLARRSMPYADAHEASMRRSWDHRRREPLDLRECVRAVRKAYSDEVPEKLHYGPEVVGDGGTPRFTTLAEGYLFGSPEPTQRLDPETKLPDAVEWYNSPFRAALQRMLADRDPAVRRRGKIVQHITVGQMGPVDAAVIEGSHHDDARIVAEHALRCFLRGLSDMRVNAAVRDPDLDASRQAVA